MSKAYSNKALPVGTVLREWRLEDVIGVGGFGIVYRGRGIYFDELVAIKEYFPSSISEREEDDTVVPVDSDAEEVHALGLKKFVEEAKLLWNLSTPSRHPNIVSVRSLFEIHGTAYMVMDFEDGQSLSKQLKDGKKFDEASLSAMILPIAEGLERAHRVGVLHRDIKPANIIVREDGSAVLIDFGSARFESGDATSTKVTFHTPPYAAIEQYVKTYDQGPWTDIYALGVVLYECVTGEKPLEVLERMHGEDDTPLAERDLPGYSQEFLKAIDAAMVIRPGDRPQSVAQWLPLFSGGIEPADDGDATRIAPMMDDPHDIQPVQPAADADAVPDAPEDATFKMASGETRAGLYAKDDAAAEAADATGDPPDTSQTNDDQPTQADAAEPSEIDAMAGEALGSGPDRSEWKKKPALPWPDEGEKAAAAAIAAARGKVAEAEAPQKENADAKGKAKTTVAAAKSKNQSSARPKWLVPAGVAALLAIVALFLLRPSDDPFAEIEEAPIAIDDEGMEEVTLEDGNSVAPDDEADTEEVAEDDTPAERPERTVERQPSDEPAQSQAAAQQPTSAPASTFSQPSATPAASASAGVTAAQRNRLAAIVREGEGLADEVQRMARGRRPGRSASDAQRAGYDTRRANAERAEGYEDYLGTLSNSMRGVSTRAEADRLIRQAEQTRQYLVFLRNNSASTER
ncbi:serine/threonine protein kinase [Sphingomicrobium marinum]|uniref:serine/threonine protein kinase n=1 Tax=Sphingomicrobium marinum TaxID=1227950 RepID=UPI00223F2D3D|nr:serine/threonine-protein kinase [Sphingomicrobium marinum]